jgi:hypothetical protein
MKKDKEISKHEVKEIMGNLEKKLGTLPTESKNYIQKLVENI